jgi:sensor histidine kinase YesM
LAPTDLCVLLGNSVDNAIEACDELPNGMERKITVECNCSSGFLFLTVRNPIAKPVSICDNRVHTTKKDRALHGFGISSMHKVAKKYDGTLKLDADEGFFTVSIDLCLPASDAVFAS